MKRTTCRLIYITLLLIRISALWLGPVRRQRFQSSALFVSFSPKSPLSSPYDNSTDINVLSPPNLDAMRARAGVLRTSILKQQLELQHLERQIICCSQSTPSLFNRTLSTFLASSNVLLRKLKRVQQKTGLKNQKWNSVGDYVTHQTATAGRIVSHLVFRNPHELKYLVDQETPTLLPHVPAILARLDRLEIHVSPILKNVLNNKRHLASIEPYLDEILERFDDIEPHLPWILDNIDILAPYTGLLLRHIDELLLYADLDQHEREMGEEYSYSYADQLLPHLEFYVSRLDVIGPHLPLLRPHLPLLLRHNRIAKVSPHMDRLFQRGYLDLNVSANLDVLLFWFGWCLNIPAVPTLFFAFPGSPRLVSFLARRMPKRFVRRYCSGVSCQVDGDYGGSWNKLASKSSSSFEEQDYM